LVLPSFFGDPHLTAREGGSLEGVPSTLKGLRGLCLRGVLRCRPGKANRVYTRARTWRGFPHKVRGHPRQCWRVAPPKEPADDCECLNNTRDWQFHFQLLKDWACWWNIPHCSHLSTSKWCQHLAQCGAWRASRVSQTRWKP
jgi:hypothetical protein